MDKERYLVAVASSDGIIVNNHFGRARTFYIYMVEADEAISFYEKRDVIPVCDGGNHDDERLIENLKLFRDCKYLLVSRIGKSAESVAEKLGIETFEIPGEIQESINQLIKYKKVNDLFK